MQLARVAVVIALVVGAAVVATPKGRVPIALRAIRKMLGSPPPQSEETKVSATRRIVAFLMVLVAFALALV